MRVLICGINYLPELVGCGKYNGELAEWLAGRGHEVRVVTTPPYYPEWRIGVGYSGWRYRRETVNGVRVYRCPLWVPRSQSGLRRVLHLLSFGVSCLPVMLAQVFWRPDVVFVVAPTLFAAPPARAAARLSRARSWLHIQDFEVEAALGLGMLKGRERLKRFLTRRESRIIRRFDRVSTISTKMLERCILDKGAAREHTTLLLNWANLDVFSPEGSDGFRRELGAGDGEILVIYSGNMGEKQGLESVIEAADSTRADPSVRYVLAGEGAAKERLMALARDTRLPNLSFLPLQPPHKFAQLLAAGDIHLVVQKSEAADLVLPSKVTNIMAAGRPSVMTAAADTELGRLADGAGVGIRVAPSAPRELAAAITELASSPDKRRAMGAKAREYAVKNLSKENILLQFEKELMSETEAQ